MLKVDNISYRRNDRNILRSVSFETCKGQLYAVIGPNGAGKSTLLNIISGRIRPSHGSVFIGEMNVAEQNRRSIATYVSYLTQANQAVPCSVEDSVMIGRKPYISWRVSKDDLIKTDKVIQELNLGYIRKKCVTQISGGEFQKSLIARALVQETDVVLMDEPINHLDIRNQIEIMDIIRHVTQTKALNTVVVMHDINLAMRYADKILLLDKGEVRRFCSPDEFDEKDVSSVYNVPFFTKGINDRKYLLY